MPRGQQHRPRHRHKRRRAARRAHVATAATPAGDTRGDFAWDATDETNILGGGAYDVRKDTTLDGTVGAADVTHANSITGGYQTLGRGVLSSTGVQNRIGYAGYKYDPHLAGAGRHLYHVRFRVFMAHIGRWAWRDLLGYVQGMSLYQYVLSQPVLRTDPSGLFSPPPPGSQGQGCGAACAGGAGAPPTLLDDEFNPIGPPPPAPPVPPDGVPYLIDDDGNPIPITPVIPSLPPECPPDESPSQEDDRTFPWRPVIRGVGGAVGVVGAVCGIKVLGPALVISGFIIVFTPDGVEIWEYYFPDPLPWDWREYDWRDHPDYPDFTDHPHHLDPLYPFPYDFDFCPPGSD